MTGKKKGPKIAWRDLMKGGAGGDAAAGTPAASRSPAVDAVAATPAVAPIPEATVAPTVAPTVEASAEPSLEAAAGGPPPEINIAPSEPAAVTASAPDASPRRKRRRDAEASAPGEPTGASTPEPTPMPAPVPELAREPEAASTPEPEPAREQSADEQVRAILDRLARRPLPPPVPQAIPVADPAEADATLAGAAAGAAPAEGAARPVGPAHAGPELQPLVPLAELRDAARARRGRVELLLFRVGGEFFAVPLGAVEEAIESPEVHTLPEMPASMLGVVRLRERLVPTYTPSGVLGVSCADDAAAALLVRAGERRLALAVDDVEDVMELDLSTLREPPLVEDLDGVLLGVARHGRELVGVLDADALIAACLGGQTSETP